MKVCNFCDVYGSAAYPDIQSRDLVDQIHTARKRVESRVNSRKFLIYFQAYTTTYSRVADLRVQAEKALASSDVVGFVIGTRPDCVSDALFDFINEFQSKAYVAIEFGVQSFDEKQLLWMSRGHTARRSIEAIKKTRLKCPGVNLGIHLMFGFPGESLADVIQSARICNSLPIDNVKLHNLHVLKNTELEKDFIAGRFQPVEFEKYSDWVIEFLRYLHPRIAVHRLSALSSRREELLAPAWTAKKMEIYQKFLDKMKALNAFQGQLCVN